MNKPYQISFVTRHINYDKYLDTLSAMRNEYPVEKEGKIRAMIFNVGMNEILRQHTLIPKKTEVKSEN